MSSGALPEASKYNGRFQQKIQSQMGVVCIPHSRSDVQTTFSHDSPYSLAGTEKRVGRTKLSYFSSWGFLVWTQIYRSSDELLWEKYTKVLRCERT